MGVTVAGSSTSLYLLPGMSVRLTAAFFFVHKGPVQHRYQDNTTRSVELLNGFVVDDEKVGTIKVSEEAGPCVVYTHNKFEFNTVTFYALTGEKGRVNIMSVPIHDHSSIVAGGPAYGTYFTDDETVGNVT